MYEYEMFATDFYGTKVPGTEKTITTKQAVVAHAVCGYRSWYEKKFGKFINEAYIYGNLSIETATKHPKS